MGLRIIPPAALLRGASARRGFYSCGVPPRQGLLAGGIALNLRVAPAAKSGGFHHGAVALPFIGAPATLLRVSSFHPGASLVQRRFQSSEVEDHYATLGVKADATQDEIKSAYKKLALEYHPDRNHDPGAEEKFKSISAAYNVIGKKDKRSEYDAQRAIFGGGGTSGGFNRGGYPGRAGPSSGYQQMSKEEADLLFREIFGGMRVDQIFRDLEEEMRRGSMRGSMGGVGRNVGRSFQSSEQVFRPYFTNDGSSQNVYIDEHGNRMEETTFRGPSGKSYTVRRMTSADPNASMNQTAEDYSSSHTSQKDGRVHYGNSSVSYSPFNSDFTQNLFGVRSHNRNPIVAFLILGVWFVVLSTLLYVLLYFLVNHPFLSLALLFFGIAGRRGRL